MSRTFDQARRLLDLVHESGINKHNFQRLLESNLLSSLCKAFARSNSINTVGVRASLRLVYFNLVHRQFLSLSQDKDPFAEWKINRQVSPTLAVDQKSVYRDEPISERVLILLFQLRCEGVCEQQVLRAGEIEGFFASRHCRPPRMYELMQISEHLQNTRDDCYYSVANSAGKGDVLIAEVDPQHRPREIRTFEVSNDHRLPNQGMCPAIIDVWG